MQTGELAPADFYQLAQRQPELQAALPGGFKIDLMQLLNQPESNVMFNSESCSYSQHDLRKNLQL